VCPLLPTRKPLLCYVTDRHGLSDDPAEAKRLLLDKIEQAAHAGVDFVQLREKDLSGRELAELTAQARRRISVACVLLVNDRLDVALANGAGGVHLGEHSLPVAEARRLASQECAQERFTVGASVHSLEAAREAVAQGANYLIFGPIFVTPSKMSFGEPQGLARLRAVCEGVRIPVIAIGGIAVDNFRDCLQAGASGIAAIRMFQDAVDLPERVSRLRMQA